MILIRTRMGENGRLVIPAQCRRALGLKPGDEVMLIMENEGLRLLTAKHAVERAQRLVRRYIPKGKRLSEELLRDRREEVLRD